jgi:hypothetical protein
VTWKAARSSIGLPVDIRITGFHLPRAIRHTQRVAGPCAVNGSVAIRAANDELIDGYTLAVSHTD